MNTISVAYLNMRTTSSVESLNAEIGRSFPKRGNIFGFIHNLKLFDYGKVYDMRRLLIEIPRGQLNRKHKKDRKRDEKISHFTSLLSKNAITPDEFLNVVSENGRY